MCYLYYVFNFFLIDSGQGKQLLCACLCQDGGIHKKACDKFHASIRSSTTIAILLKSVVSACQDPWPCPQKEHLFYITL